MTNHRGFLLIISSPSGAGKTTLCRSLQNSFPQLYFSVSYTTRKPRPFEKDGIDYVFVDSSAFEEMVQKNAFAEWAFIHGNRYGTTVESVRIALELGKDVLFDIDYQGAESLCAQFPMEARLIYILPPSMEILATRLRARGTESPERISQRLSKAQEELAHYESYHYLVVNDDRERAVAELSAIYLYESARLRQNLSVEQARAAEVTALSCKREHRAHLAEALLNERIF